MKQKRCNLYKNYVLTCDFQKNIVQLQFEYVFIRLHGNFSLRFHYSGTMPYCINMGWV